MTATAISYGAGQAPGVSLKGTRVDFLLTAEDSKGCSMFELHVAPGFDTGAHYHTKIEETFYVLEGTLALRLGDRWREDRELRRVKLLRTLPLA